MTLETPPLVVLSSVLLTEVYVVQPIVLESGTILMDQWCLIMLLVMISTEVTGTMLSLQLDHSVVNYLIPWMCHTDSVLH